MVGSRVGIIIPAFNEALTIERVVSAAHVHGVPIVVDDHSADSTAEDASAAGAVVVRLDHRRGYDGALNAGFRQAAELECTCVVTMDADGQHDAALVDAFVAAIDGGADLVAGTRDRRQRWSERLFAIVGRLRWGLPDPLCGMKGYRMTLYTERGYFDSYQSIGTELALFAASRGKRIAHIPVKTRPRAGRARFGRGLNANLRIVRAMLRGLRRY